MWCSTTYILDLSQYLTKCKSVAGFIMGSDSDDLVAESDPESDLND